MRRLRLILTEVVRSRFTVFVFVFVSLTGCRTGGTAQSPTVSFPEVHLGGGEFIQEFKVRVKGGRVTALHRVPHDWDISLEWEDGDCVVLRGQARHFSSGLSGTDRLNASIELESEPALLVQAMLRTERPDPAGGGGRKIPLRRLALSPPVTLLPSRERKPGPAFRIAGRVTDRRSGSPVSEFLVTPRYAFTNTVPAVYGPWEEYDGERFQEGRFNLSYDQPFLAGAKIQPAWQFLVEAEGYEPFITRVVGNTESGAHLDCRMIPTAVPPHPEVH